MKKFFVIYKFELTELMRSKALTVTVIMLALLMVAGSFIPKIVSLFSGSTENESSLQSNLPVYHLALPESLQDEQFDKFVEESLNVDTVVIPNTIDSINTIKEKIEAGSDDKLFAFGSELEFAYYVRNAGTSDYSYQAVRDTLLKFLQKRVLDSYGVENRETFYDPGITYQVFVLGKNQDIGQFLVFVIDILIYMVIIIFSSILANNIIMEKTSKTVEVIVTSVDTTRLLFAKWLAFMTYIVVAAIMLFLVGKHTVGNLEEMRSVMNLIFRFLPKADLITCIGFALCGIGLYLFVVAIVAAFTTRMEDANGAIMPVMVFIVIPYFITLFNHNTNGIIFKVCSYIPFFSPIMMPARFLYDDVSKIEIIISFAVLIGSTVIAGIVASILYRKGILNQGNKPKLLSLFGKKQKA
ncbi:MAG: ABC transporter permease [Spirochaetaceae bacterium]|nr:ABC transporter permease [Spirochaetaceae bacterium]